MDWNRLLCPDRIREVRPRYGSKDLRTEFEKDYHRIIGSASFRRLQDKTQVFPLDRSDFVRTRLTHSLEVSSFAKSLGQNISQKLLLEIKDSTFIPSYQMVVCDILQCAGLLHDIGNPPFGHFGETVIREWFRGHLGELKYKDVPLGELLNEQMCKDLCYFEGNTQALRLVTKLHYLVDEHGMNLTKALLGTIIKYPVSSLEIHKNSGDVCTKKMGYYYAEREIFADIQESLGTEGRRHPLAYVLEAADDIAYRTADIEDACKKGCLTYTQLLEELQAGGAEEPEGSPYLQVAEKLERKYKQAVERGIPRPEVYAVQNWIVYVQGKLIYCATDSFTKHYREIMDGSYREELLTEGYGKKLCSVLGGIAMKYVFSSPQIFKLEIAAQTMISSLLDKFVPAAVCYDSEEQMSEVQRKLMTLISDNYKKIYQVYGLGCTEEERLYLRLLLVTDSICGMTDSHAKRLYQELNGID